MYSLLNTVGIIAVLSLAISHMGWLVTQSGIMRPLRELVTQSVLREGIHCIMCTVTQLSLLLAWLLPDVIGGPAPVVYVVKAMMLAKVSLLVYDLGEWVGTLSIVGDSSNSDEGLPSDALASSAVPSTNYTIELQ